MKNKDWERGVGGGGGGLNREEGLINFPPLKRGCLFGRGGLIEDLQYGINTHSKKAVMLIKLG